MRRPQDSTTVKCIQGVTLVGSGGENSDSTIDHLSKANIRHCMSLGGPQAGHAGCHEVCTGFCDNKSEGLHTVKCRILK